MSLSSALPFGIEKAVPLVVVNCQGHPSPLLRRADIVSGFFLSTRAAVKVKHRIGPPSGVPLRSNTLISAVGGGRCLAPMTWHLPTTSVLAFSEVIGFLSPCTRQ